MFVPDCVVAFGVDPVAIVSRNGYVIQHAGKPPDFVLEVASISTGRRDYTVKRVGYAGYGVREYWRFRPHRRTVPRRTAGRGRFDRRGVHTDTYQPRSRRPALGATARYWAWTCAGMMVFCGFEIRKRGNT